MALLLACVLAEGSDGSWKSMEIINKNWRLKHAETAFAMVFRPRVFLLFLRRF